eukprot:9050795-Alexandrium_andersonii.AAC.1
MCIRDSPSSSAWRARTSPRVLKKLGSWLPRSAAAGSGTGDGRTLGGVRSPSSCGPTWTGARTSPSRTSSRWTWGTSSRSWK